MSCLKFLSARDEIISWAKIFKRKLFILKVDFEKAFDTLSWSFLDSIMYQMGFGLKWRNWIKGCLRSSFTSVLVNGSPTLKFKIEKGLHQGDPLSPLLFILVMEALNVVLVEAKNKHVFQGIEVGKDKVSPLVPICLEALIGILSLSVFLNVLRGEKLIHFHSEIAWVAWDRVISPFSQGGLNIGSIGVSNLGLLSKWWWRFFSEDNSFWCKVIRSIHGPQGGLHDASLIKSKSGPWYRISKLKEDLSVHGIDLHSLYKIKIGNGENTRFWIDKWVGDTPLSIVFPRLFRLETQTLCGVCDRSSLLNTFSALFLFPVPAAATNGLQSTHAFPSGRICDYGSAIPNIGEYDPPRLRFRWAWSRDLRSTDRDELIELQSLLCNFQFTSDQDKWECLIDSSRRFSVKGMRKLIMNSPPLSYTNPTRWNKLVPIKVNIASWRVENLRIPTRINLDYRGIALHST
ncbi:RNA-directed DNA polymerase, eukaryota, reverse transcriptase zinc-binding domain protein [Tanacetum coccineum]